MGARFGGKGSGFYSWTALGVVRRCLQFSYLTSDWTFTAIQSPYRVSKFILCQAFWAGNLRALIHYPHDVVSVSLFIKLSSKTPASLFNCRTSYSSSVVRNVIYRHFVIKSLLFFFFFQHFIYLVHFITWGREVRILKLLHNVLNPLCIVVEPPKFKKNFAATMLLARLH